ncbi:DUF1206 domain-containing protein [Demequina sp. SYSU T00068]|uniref:DUF1206 domain-containing protein n=1 Tax=Demequina lignilytica TaxID=3051663 RepID=UPI00261CC416|nr:DUF1206 domain-containing protein [Demequina sp. SYSU T00068]MDN4490508.1 DUF1206 domain-containing protein [Demequina sp. SYSU T00068]
MDTASASSARAGTSGDIWETAARAGFFVSGLLHLILGYVIVRIGLGSGGEADSSSALSRLRDAPAGPVILWGSALAFLALALWQLFDSLRGRQEAMDRAKAGGKFVMYAALAVSAASIAMGGGDSSGDQQASGLAATLMGAPGGPIIVGAIGLGILAGGVYHVIKGARKKFLDDLKPMPGKELGTGVKTVGTVGYIAKGIALGAVGVLFVTAAMTADPDQAKGIDGGIEALLGMPGGPVIVILIGVGFAAYGLYSFARARYARMHS